MRYILTLVSVTPPKEQRVRTEILGNWEIPLRVAVGHFPSETKKHAGPQPFHEPREPHSQHVCVLNWDGAIGENSV